MIVLRWELEPIFCVTLPGCSFCRGQVTSNLPKWHWEPTRPQVASRKSACFKGPSFELGPQTGPKGNFANWQAVATTRCAKKWPYSSVPIRAPKAARAGIRVFGGSTLFGGAPLISATRISKTSGDAVKHEPCYMPRALHMGPAKAYHGIPTRPRAAKKAGLAWQMATGFTLTPEVRDHHGEKNGTILSGRWVWETCWML